jgi:hypothetical protein
LRLLYTTENKLFEALKHYSKMQKKNQMLKRRHQKQQVYEQHIYDENGYPSPQKKEDVEKEPEMQFIGNKEGKDSKS